MRPIIIIIIKFRPPPRKYTNFFIFYSKTNMCTCYVVKCQSILKFNSDLNRFRHIGHIYYVASTLSFCIMPTSFHAEKSTIFNIILFKFHIYVSSNCINDYCSTNESRNTRDIQLLSDVSWKLRQSFLECTKKAIFLGVKVIAKQAKYIP